MTIKEEPEHKAGSMDDDKRIQGFLDLYKQQMQQFRNTQGIEWKANIGYWTLLAGANYFVAQHSVWISLLWALPICVLKIGRASCRERVCLYV